MTRKWNYPFSHVDDWPVFKDSYFSITICPRSDWFESSIIGEIVKPDKGPVHCVLRLPFQVARAMIEDFKREESQSLTINYNRSVKGNGQVFFPVVGIDFGDMFA